MEYKDLKPQADLARFVHSFWELTGGERDQQWERIFPDGCTGLVINLGDSCKTDNGNFNLSFGKTYVAGVMTTFKDSFINSDTRLMGVCFKPGAFSNFFKYADQNELINATVEFEKSYSFNIDKILSDPYNYLNSFLSEKLIHEDNQLTPILNEIHCSNGQLGIDELSKRNFRSVRQLERQFKKQIGISPKAYSNIIRFQNAWAEIKQSKEDRSLLDIAFDCGFYDHSHLTNEFKRNTGHPPSQA